MTAISESPRFKSDLRQMGGILFAFSAMALVFPLADYTNLVTGDGSTGGTTLSMVMLIGDICVLGVGLLGMAVGFGLLTDGGSANLTFVACVWEQTVFIEWISKMVNTKNAPFMSPDAEDGKFYRSMGILTMITLCFLFYGAIGAVLFTIHAYQKGDAASRNASYYRGRLVFYGMLYFGQGMFRFLVQGAYVLSTQGNGRLMPPQKVVAGVIFYPEIHIFLGCFYVLNGLWAIKRGMKGERESTGPSDPWFQRSIGLNYLCYFVLVVMTEMALPDGPNPGAAVVTVVTLNGHLLLAWLDDRAQSTPEVMDDAYFWEGKAPAPEEKQEQAKLVEEPEEPEDQA